ncbi:MAG: hypothetical protein U5K00_02285 [Melioribacteraceae bacterium]|nr:hypothetical protein [Melioribacteraceae bacterium]
MQIDKPRSNCGIFGIYNSTEAALNTYYGLHALQHRGQEAAGIITLNSQSEKKSLKFTKDLVLFQKFSLIPKYLMH